MAYEVSFYKHYSRFLTGGGCDSPRSRKCAICDDHRRKLSNISNLAERFDLQAEKNIVKFLRKYPVDFLELSLAWKEMSSSAFHQQIKHVGE